jgi:hypothetical protein
MVSASSWIVWQESSWMGSQIISIFSVVLLVPGYPELSSLSTDTRSALKWECHSKTTVWLKECPLKASQGMSRLSVVDLPSFTQNLMQTHCSILPSIADKMKHKVV